MRISALEIKNYRNLDGVEIKLHPTMNFIIGENNLGKSNLLDLLNILFNRNNFAESDFLNLDEQIHITFSLGLSEIEQGFFDDLFDPTDREKINIVAVQESPDDVIRFQHQESGTVISNSIVRCVNYINYDSLRNPSSELSFSKNRGVGKFLNHIIVKYLKDGSLQDFDFVIIEKIDEFLIEVNQSLQKIKSFKDFSVQAIREENKENLLAKLILLADDNNRALESLGYGVQFSIIITLSIFERLLSLSKQRLDRCIIEDSSNSEKCIPVLIGLDEPEIHLHPYAQRSLIKYLGRVVNNNELDFSSLLTDIFQINRLLGQILVVSHSPNILLNDYRQFLRFYKSESGCLIVKSGFDIDLDEATEKQLLKNLPYVKEAFFSKVVILVEGDTELGALPIFSKRMNIDLDEFGISIIQAGGAKSIPSLMQLLNEFGIKNIGLMDRDQEAEYSHISGLSFTQGQDFEEDIYESFNITDYVKYLEKEFPGERKADYFIGKVRAIDTSLDPHNLIHPQLESLSPDKLQELKNLVKQDILKNMRDNKSILDGGDLGKYVTEIPEVYKSLIQKAVELSKNVESIGTESIISEA
jgi:putative ATP-dependent endonuclease of the OLD family